MASSTEAMVCRIAPILLALAFAIAGTAIAPQAVGVPGPEVEYTYNVVVRRHFSFPHNDAIGYGYGMCDKVASGMAYDQLMSIVKRDVLPNDDHAASYVISNGIGILCPAQIAQLRKLAAGYRPDS